MTGGTNYWHFAGLIIAAFAAAGCSTWSERGEIESRRVSGLLENRQGQWHLEPCNQEQELIIADAGELDTLFDRVTQPGQTAIFVDLEGTVRADWSMRVERILRMESAGRGCAAERAATEHWVAESLSRDWRMVIDRQGIEFTDEQNQATGPVAMISEQLPDGVMSFRSEQDAALELWLYPQQCFDYVNDFRHLTATLIVDGKRMNGCAYKGASPR
ncbi:hypothetical protein [Pseudomonas sp.]|uniref:hypothetical protein n=1 Tax=Pseudomonas sp. TaxID=306 RepID=UPI00272C8682|nr:hypothetical protein [Pseudomonas sp.]